MCTRDEMINGKLRVHRADPQDIDKMPAIGVLVSKSTPTVGIIQLYGLCEVYSGLDLSQTVYFLGTDGRISDTQPIVGLGGYSFIQLLGTPVSSGILQINNGGMNMIKKVA